MPAKWQRVKIDIPKDLRPNERRAVAQEIIDHIVTRTQKGKGVDARKNLPRYDGKGKSIGKYSARYVNSPEFKGGAKRASLINLTLSSEMLENIELLSHRAGQLLIGFKKGTVENAKAEGNILGTYGQKKPVTTGRDFLGVHEPAGRKGLTKTAKENILKKYSNEDARKIRTLLLERLRKDARRVIGGVILEEGQ